jgi:hypothetical protein
MTSATPNPPVQINKAINVFLYILATVMGLIVLFLLILTSGALVNSAKMMVSGAPPLATLTRTEGILVYLRPCWSARSGARRQGVTIKSATETTGITLPCVIDMQVFRDSQDRHIVAYVDKRWFAYSEVYQVDFDGYPLLAYADQARRNVEKAKSHMISNLIATLFSAGLLLFLIWLLHLHKSGNGYRVFRTHGDDD